MLLLLTRRIVARNKKNRSFSANWRNGDCPKVPTSTTATELCARYQCASDFVRALQRRAPLVVLDNVHSQRWEYAQHVAVARACGYAVQVGGRVQRGTALRRATVQRSVALEATGCEGVIASRL